jgi:glycylpeptide N-tetradecanoyltransferase
MSEFWITQPVGRGKSIGTIDPTPSLNVNPTQLPHLFSWRTVDDVSKISKFLEKFYVEDVSCKYRLLYSCDFFKFLFEHPKHKKEYSLGLFYRDEMIGYILAREHDLVLRNIHHPAVSINFLCIDREFRNKNFAPLMIKEITRIANLNNIFKAIFTAERDYGFSISKARYYHYPLRVENLLKAEIIESPDEIMEAPFKRNDTIIAKDIPQSKIYSLYHKMCKDFTIHEEIPNNICDQVFSGKEDVIVTIYNEHSEEFASFFIIKTVCIDSGIVLKRAYLYYWAGSTRIVQDAIAVAYQMDVDMFDILNIAQNNEIIKSLKLLEGSGVLNYHLFNLNEEPLDSSNINFILF